jgi:hypothetical protein
MVNAVPLWLTPNKQALLEHAGDPLGGEREIDFDAKPLAVVVIDDVEGSKRPAMVQGIAHEIC